MTLVIKSDLGVYHSMLELKLNNEHFIFIINFVINYIIHIKLII